MAPVSSLHGLRGVNSGKVSLLWNSKTHLGHQ